MPNNLNIEIRPATQSDLDYASANPYHDILKSGVPSVIMPNTFTWYCEDRIIAVGGVGIPWPGMGEFWVVITKQFDHGDFSRLKTLHFFKKWVDDTIEAAGLIRSQAIVRANFNKAIKMLEFLGFTNETPDGMKCYFPDGSTAFRYSKIRRPDGNER